MESLVGYFDSAHGDAINRRSTYGSPIPWASKVQKTVALSTTEAEYMAGTGACKELIWLHSTYKGLNQTIAEPTILRGDSTGSISLSKNPEFHQLNKHAEIRERLITSLVVSVLYTSLPGTCKRIVSPNHLRRTAIMTTLNVWALIYDSHTPAQIAKLSLDPRPS